MAKKLKQAFTITELVIVIAVVAILAAVLIPTFANIINKANESADTQTVANINRILSAEEIVNGQPDTMYEAMQAVEEGGYKVENLTPTREGYDMVWDEQYNRFALLDENGKTVYGAGEVTQDKWKLWKIVDGIPENYAEEGYSYYAGPEFNQTEVLVSAGFDAGENGDITAVTLSIPEGTAKDVTVRTNGGAFTVDAPDSDVSHSGTAASLAVEAVAANSYREYGDIDGRITVKSGRFVLEKAQEISELTAEPGAGQSVGLVLPSGTEIEVFTVNNGEGQSVTVTNNGAAFGHVFAEDTEKLTFTGSGEKPSVEKYTAVAFHVAEVDGGVEVTGISGEVPATLVIPSEIGGQKVVSIGLEAFGKEAALKTVVIAEGVKTIGEAAFWDSGLQSISLPDSLETIGEDAFYECAALQKIEIPNGVANIARKTFYGCTALEVADISGAVTVDTSAFENCTSLSTVIFGYNLQEIGGAAFQYCALTSVDFRNISSLAVVGSNAFNHCEQLESVYIGDSITTLGSQAFAYCPNIKTVAIGSGLKYLGNDPDNASVSGSFMPVFRSSGNAVSVTVDENNHYYSDMGGNCIVYHAPGSSEYTLMQGFVSSVIPEGVTVIGERAFQEVNITQVTLPDSVSKIEKYAFKESALTKIDLNNIQTVGGGAFENCSALQEVHVGAALTDFDEPMNGVNMPAFKDCSALRKITCDAANQIFAADENGNALLTEGSKKLVLGTISGIVPDGVETIAPLALSHKQLKRVVLPISLKKVEDDAFLSVLSNLQIYYKGTAEQWGGVNKGSYNDKLTNGTIYYYSDTDPGTEGNYWHWAGEPGGEIEVW